MKDNNKVLKVAGGAVVGGAAGYGLAKFTGWGDKKIVAYLEAKKARDGKLNSIYQTQSDRSKHRLDHPKTVTAAHVATGALLGGAAGSMYSGEDTTQFSEEFIDNFSTYYSETEDIYGDNMEEAFNDFVEMSQDEYGFVSTMGNMASKAGSAIKTGATAVGGAAKKTLGSTMKSAATGADLS